MCEHKKVTSKTGNLLENMFVVIIDSCNDCNAYKARTITYIKEPGFTYCGSKTTEWVIAKNG
jgi:hypothetical protein